MKIEFDKIIEKANIRKDKLIELTTLLNEADTMLQNLAQVIEWNGALRELFRTLDQEGRDLLPRTVNNTLSCANNIATSLAQAYQHTNGFGLVYLKEPK